jgi:hypothetical protein
MKLAARWLLIVVVFAVLYQGASRMLALAGDDEGLSLARLLLHQARRYEALRLRNQEMTAARDVKSAAVEEYIAGQLSLAELIEQFHKADRLIENDRQGLVAPYVVPETKAELCSQVRVWIEIVLQSSHDSHQAELVRYRLEEEVYQLFPAQKIGHYPDMAKALVAPLELR